MTTQGCQQHAVILEKTLPQFKLAQVRAQSVHKDRRLVIFDANKRIFDPDTVPPGFICPFYKAMIMAASCHPARILIVIASPIPTHCSNDIR